MEAVSAKDGKLTFRHQGKDAEIHLGPEAPKWADAVLHPKSRLEKLGITEGITVAVLGDAPDDFLAEIPGQAASPAAGLRIFFAGSRRDLKRVNTRLAPLWIVYPKGQEEITQAEVIAAGRAAGLVDVKVMAFPGPTPPSSSLSAKREFAESSLYAGKPAMLKLHLIVRVLADRGAAPPS